MRHRGRSGFALFLLSAFISVSACGSSSGGGSPGDGGAFPGFGGTAGGSGGAFGGGGDCQLLPCFTAFATLVSQCAGTGACTKQGSANTVGSSAHYCFANGVKEHLSIQSSFMATARFTRPDGLSTCYSIDLVTGRSDNSLGFSYRDGSGSLVGTADTHADGSLTMTCGGVSKTISEACLDQMDTMMPSTSTRGCVDGSCQ
jgi:hypothetical protein